MTGEGLDRIGKGVWERERWKGATWQGREHRREPQWWGGRGCAPRWAAPSSALPPPRAAPAATLT